MKPTKGENTQLPEYIEGIPTEKKRSKERRIYHKNLWLFNYELNK